MDTDLFLKLCVIILDVLGIVFIIYILPLLKNNLTEQQLKNITYWVEVAVAGAEQYFIKNKGFGEEKKKMVLEFLGNKGFEVNTVELDMLIEAVVLKFHK